MFRIKSRLALGPSLKPILPSTIGDVDPIVQDDAYIDNSDIEANPKWDLFSEQPQRNDFGGNFQLPSYVDHHVSKSQLEV